MTQPTYLSNREIKLLRDLRYQVRRFGMSPEGFRYLIGKAAQEGADWRRVYEVSLPRELGPDESAKLPPLEEVAPEE